MLPKLNNVEFNEDKATPFHVVAPFEPMGDQPEAIEALAAGIETVSYTHLRAHET